ncbi:MAG: xylulokinase [Proteobacteria bacterium]|nr:MAG: xylulokinase [Pseudomonadota bacterium]
MTLGIDLGTSAVKAVLVDGADRVLAQQSAPLAVARPRPTWSEQDPADWWRAADAAVRALRAAEPDALAAIAAVGLSGQMHGATLLDASDALLRPAILWNDGRSAAQCAALERAVPRAREITGNRAMPGFTAPKLLWVREHEPALFARVRRVLLPKDWLRLRITGDAATDCSDASGTLWLDVGARAWSDAMLAACGLDERAMPRLFEGSEATGVLRADVANAWGVARVPVAAGAGDQAAGAAGAGVVRPGEASLALGTSGVLFVAGDRFRPHPAGAVHAFCHCLPGTWHQMAVLLSAASCLAWAAKLTGAASEAALLAEVEAHGRVAAGALLFLPYLSGERTPHDDPAARGVFFGLSHDTDRALLARAVLEGVAFAFADAQDVLAAAGAAMREVSVIGGGAQSALWGRILASVLDRPLVYRAGADVGPAHGAARLARIAATGAKPADVCVAPPVAHVIEPDPALRDAYRAALPRWRTLYARLRASFAELLPASGGER